VHRRRNIGASSFVVPDAAQEAPAPQVAVGLERHHSEFPSPSKGVMIQRLRVERRVTASSVGQ
jgi:hypothetical protein